MNSVHINKETIKCARPMIGSFLGDAHNANYMNQSSVDMSHSDVSLSRSRSRSHARSSGQVVKKSKTHGIKEKLKAEKDKSRQLEENLNKVNEDLASLKAAHLELLSVLESNRVEINDRNAVYDVIGKENEFMIIEKKRKLDNSMVSSQQVSKKPVEKPQQMSMNHLAKSNNQDQQPCSSAQANAMQAKLSLNLPKTIKMSNKPPSVFSPQQAPINNNTHPVSGTSTTRTPINTSSQQKGGLLTAIVPVKPPPIVTSCLNIKKATEHLAEALGHNNFHFRPAAAGDTSIITHNEIDFKKAIDMVKSSDIEGHAYTLKSEKVHNIILRNLCRSFDVEDISRGIEEMQIDVRVRNIEKYSTPFSAKNNQDLNLWLIQLEPGSDVKALLSCKSILHLNGVRFELKKNQGAAQCRNCQAYGHSAINCYRKFRCVKCTEDHEHGNCKKHATEDEVACVNCGENHPANYRGCRIYQDLLKRIEDKKKRERELQNQRQEYYNNYRQPNVSYSNVAGSRRTPNQRPTKNDNNRDTTQDLGFDIQAECYEQFGMDFRSIRQRLTEFAPIYRKSEDKSIALLQFIMSIHPKYH